MENLAENFRFILAFSNFFSGLPLEAEGGSFSLRLSLASIVTTFALQLWCPADPQACPTLAQQMCHPEVGQTVYYPVLIVCLSKGNNAESP